EFGADAGAHFCRLDFDRRSRILLVQPGESRQYVLDAALVIRAIERLEVLRSVIAWRDRRSGLENIDLHRWSSGGNSAIEHKHGISLPFREAIRNAITDGGTAQGCVVVNHFVRPLDGEGLGKQLLRISGRAALPLLEDLAVVQ